MADEYIRLDTTIIGIDSLINKAPTAEEAKVLFTAKDVIYSQQRYVADVQPVRRRKWEGEHYDDLLECFIATCPVCGYESTDKYKISDNHRCCEHCGAKMDLKDGDAE